MNLEALKILRSSDHAVHLRDLLICHFGLDEGVHERESSGAATEQEVAGMTVIRLMFGEEVSEPHEVSHKLQMKALVWLRRQRVGRIMKGNLADVIRDTRYTYESNVANESTRLLLLAYKQAKDILYEKDLGEALCSPKS